MIAKIFSDFNDNILFYYQVVEVLLEFGCDVDCVDADNRTALR